MRPTLACLALVLAAGCGTHLYRPAGSWRVRPDAPAQVSDDEIRSAFDARPQVPDRVRVAYFGFDRASSEELGAMLRELPGVEDVYEIAPLFVTGQRRFDEAPEEPRELNMRQLRLAAARAQCEVLVVVDNGYRVRQDVNGWIALAPLIVPMFFTPYIDTHVDSYVDAYVIDVRNGYLYGHLSSHEEGSSTEDTMWAEVGARISREHRGVLLERTRVAIEALLSEGRGEAPTAPVAQVP